MFTPIKKRSYYRQNPKYGLNWYDETPLGIEMEMVRQGGLITIGRTKYGHGLAYHLRTLQEILWPEKVWHRWAILELECYCKYTYIGEMGCAAAGKTFSSGTNVLAEWYCFPDSTTVLVSSTDLKSLDMRAWGVIKRFHRLAKERFPMLPGHLIEGRRLIVNNPKDEAAQGRDFKNGLCAVPCKHGETFIGLGSYVGIHNDRVRLVADELHLMARAFMDSVSNLSKCPDFKLVGDGNPNDTANAHGVLCEPSQDIGGWESGIDQGSKTNTWPTRFPNGICIQLPGGDSPNMDTPEGDPVPYPFLMTRQQMQDDSEIWGTTDWHYTMMNEARMPRGQGTRRFITRQKCQKFQAQEAPNWLNSNRIKIACLDAAYRGVGGDRCVFMELQFGAESELLNPETIATNLIFQNKQPPQYRQILALLDTQIVPIKAEISSDLPEDQIVRFVMDQCKIKGIPPENFFFDSGMRTSLVTAFARLWSPQVNSIDCGGKPTDRNVSGDIQIPAKDYYSKYITELWFSVSLIIEARQFRGLTNDAMSEGCAREWKHTSGNKIEAESKEEMKLKTGRSPDLFDCLAIGCEGARRRGFIIQRLAGERRSRANDAWKRALQKKASDLWRSKELNHAA